MSLPDACAHLVLHDQDDDSEQSGAEPWESPRPDRHRSEEPDGYHRDWPDNEQGNDCCRALSGSGSMRCASTGSLRSAPSLHIPMDNSRTGTCSRREQPTRTENPHHRSSTGEWFGGGGGGGGGRGRLSAAVPDVAMAPNANTHLLAPREYFRPPPAPPVPAPAPAPPAPPCYWEYGGVVLQLDLGDGATHTPRPGSRAQRNSAAAQHNPNRQREHAQISQAISCLRARTDEEELRQAIELSVMRAYSSFHGRAGGSGAGSGAGSAASSSSAAAALPVPHRSRANAATLPPHYRADPPLATPPSGSPRLGASASAPRADRLPHLALPAGSASPSPSPSPRRRDYAPRSHHDYRLDPGAYGGGGGGGGSASTSRGHSPNNYA